MTGCCGFPQTGLVLVQNLSQELRTVSSLEFGGAGAPWVRPSHSHLFGKQSYNHCLVKTDPFPKCSVPVVENLCRVSGARRKMDLEKHGGGTAERACSLGAKTPRVGCAALRVCWQSFCSRSSKAVTQSKAEGEAGKKTEIFHSFSEIPARTAWTESRRLGGKMSCANKHYI